MWAIWRTAARPERRARPARARPARGRGRGAQRPAAARAGAAARGRRHRPALRPAARCGARAHGAARAPRAVRPRSALGVLVLVAGAAGVAGAGRDRPAAGGRLRDRSSASTVGRCFTSTGALLREGRDRHRLPAGGDRAAVARDASSRARATARRSRSRLLVGDRRARAAVLAQRAPGHDERYVHLPRAAVLLPATLALARREVSAAGLGDRVGAARRCCSARVPWSPRPGRRSATSSRPSRCSTRAPSGCGSDRVPARRRRRRAGVLRAGARRAGVALAWALARRRHAAARPASSPCWSPLVALTSRCRRSTRCPSTSTARAARRSAERPRARVRGHARRRRARRSASSLEGAAKTPPFFPLWQEVQFYNQRIDSGVLARAEHAIRSRPATRSTGVSFDREDRTASTSRCRTTSCSRPRSRPGGCGARSSTPRRTSPAALLQVKQPAAMAWTATGFDPDGAIRRARRPTSASTAPAARAFTAPRGAGRRPTRLAPARQTARPARGDVAPGQTGRRSIPLGSASGDRREASAATAMRVVDITALRVLTAA